MYCGYIRYRRPLNVLFSFKILSNIVISFYLIAFKDIRQLTDRLRCFSTQFFYFLRDLNNGWIIRQCRKIASTRNHFDKCCVFFCVYRNPSVFTAIITENLIDNLNRLKSAAIFVLILRKSDANPIAWLCVRGCRIETKAAIVR